VAARAAVAVVVIVFTHGQYAEPTANTDTQARPISTQPAAMGSPMQS
jgi:hypothetical protein